MIGVDALQWLKEQGGIHTTEIDGHTWALEGIARVKPLKENAPACMEFHTLDGILDYASTQFKEEVVKGEDIIGLPALQVVDHGVVKLYGPMQPAIGNLRWLYAKTTLIAESFKFGTWFSQDDFIIQLMGKFVHDDNLMALIGMVASITSVQERKMDDDGISPMIEIRQGLRMREEKKLENPITLAPWRTFREIEQPSSEFVIRIDDNDRRGGLVMCLHEADGAKWQMDAMTNIADYLNARMTSDSWPEEFKINVFS